MPKAKRVFLLFLPGCADEQKATDDDKISAASQKVTVKKILAANHPDARLSSVDSITVTRSGENDTETYFDKDNYIFETSVSAEKSRLIENLSEQISKIGTSFYRSAFEYATNPEEWYPYLIFPSTLSSYFKRMHRWTRGDWQLLPFLRGRMEQFPRKLG